MTQKVDRYWIVSMKVFAFDTENEAKVYQDALISAFTAMPESEGFAATSTILEEVEVRDDDNA